jgi:hypothetical protein
VDPADVAIIALLTLGAGAVVVYGAGRGKLLQTTLIALAVVAVLWALAALATATGWKDADGWVDCRDSCSALQYATGATLAGGILVGAALVVVALVAAVRARRGSSPG